MLPHKPTSASSQASDQLASSAEKSNEAVEKAKPPVVPSKEAEQRVDNSLPSSTPSSNKATDSMEKSTPVQEEKEFPKKYALKLISPLEEPKEVERARRLARIKEKDPIAKGNLEKPAPEYREHKVVWKELASDQEEEKESDTYKSFIINSPQKQQEATAIIEKNFPAGGSENPPCYTTDSLLKAKECFRQASTNLEATLIYNAKAVGTGKSLPLSAIDELAKREKFADSLYKASLFAAGETSTTNIGMVRLTAPDGKRILLVASSAKLNIRNENAAIRTLKTALHSSKLSTYVDIVYLVTEGGGLAETFGFKTNLKVKVDRGVSVYLCAEPKLAAEYEKLQKIYGWTLKLEGESHILFTQGPESYSMDVIRSCDECAARVNEFEDLHNNPPPPESLSPPRTYSYDSFDGGGVVVHDGRPPPGSGPGSGSGSGPGSGSGSGSGPDKPRREHQENKEESRRPEKRDRQDQSADRRSKKDERREKRDRQEQFADSRGRSRERERRPEKRDRYRPREERRSRSVSYEGPRFFKRGPDHGARSSQNNNENSQQQQQQRSRSSSTHK